MIRVGFFENFRGADTLLIDLDAEGLRALTTWLGDVTSSERTVPLSTCPGVSLRSGLRVEVILGPDDVGLSRTADTAFVWQRSKDGWKDVVALLTEMGSGACHQYLDSPQDDVRVMASTGEYGEEWWNRHGT